MAAEPGWARRVATVARWPLGMALTSWRYLWRTTPLHRVDEEGGPDDAGPALASSVEDERIQRLEDGVGALFRRRYGVRIDRPRMSAEQLMAMIMEDPNRPAPVEVALFRKTGGDKTPLEPGDEFVVRMPGPWDGPVRVVDRSPTSFRLATLRGHLEAGQIEFRAHESGSELWFEIESWTRSGDRLCELLYDRVRIVKEMQLHMWVHYCERAGKLAGGRMRGGVHVHTRRYRASD